MLDELPVRTSHSRFAINIDIIFPTAVTNAFWVTTSTVKPTFSSTRATRLVVNTYLILVIINRGPTLPIAHSQRFQKSP